MRLPLGSGPSDRHVPIFVSPDVSAKSRVVVVLGEPTQKLGLLAGRVANGPGGIDKGSMVSVVREIRRQKSTASDPSPPGVVLANTGELYWWPRGQRALTVSDSAAVPLPSLVHAGVKYVDGVNDVPGNRNPEEHVAYVFDEVLRTMMSKDCRVSVVAIGQSCELVARFLDSTAAWERWCEHLDAALLLGTVYPVEDLANDALKTFLARKSRGYILSSDPLDAPLAPPSGHPAENIPPLGCPCYSSGESSYTENILIRALAPALGYLEHVATTPDYHNGDIVVVERPQEDINQDDWAKVPDGDKPTITAVGANRIKEEVRMAKRWRRAVRTGEAPDTDSSDEDFS